MLAIAAQFFSGRMDIVRFCDHRHACVDKRTEACPAARSGPCLSYRRSLYVHGMCAGEVLTKTLHRASTASERDRILARGGYIPECGKGECARVNGLIEVTRSLGDRWLKPILDCTPEVACRDLRDDDAFLVLGTDGLFDFIDDAAVVWPIYSNRGAD
jgi:hypothetical protein